jgi:anti-sigma B factor antagonist
VSATEFSARTAQVGAGAYVLSLAGEADLHAAPALERELETAVEEGGVRLVVDLFGVSFIDSSIFGLLLRYRSRVGPHGGEVVVVCDDRRILRALEVTGMDRRLRVETSLLEAVRPRDRAERWA